eukprot:CAMPEP_0113481826 /NCGR_PEP_ID=MMETSP0014_2-20120614/22606_1 /TAXON_ID=2857 /ORGANISM="Nitzschia sp." /LENGTH=657 /DNA_ID=CAMNT_0000375329 /DNA_START=335 /DNA_END=2308 /DNA_ORIENTATION=+ /assembly_acc=CAM_ASM_000159
MGEGRSTDDMTGGDGNGNEDINRQSQRQEFELLQQQYMSSYAGRSDPTDSLDDDSPGSISSDLFLSDQEELDRRGPIVPINTAGDLMAVSNPSETTSATDVSDRLIEEKRPPIHAGSGGDGKNQNTSGGATGSIALDIARNALRRAFEEAAVSSTNVASSNSLSVNQLQQAVVGISNDGGHGDGGRESLMAMLSMGYGIGQGMQQQPVPARQAPVATAPSPIDPLPIRRQQQQMQYAANQLGVQPQSNTNLRSEFAYSAGTAAFGEGGYASSSGVRTTESSTSSSSLSSAIGSKRFPQRDASTINSAVFTNLTRADTSTRNASDRSNIASFVTEATALSRESNRRYGERHDEMQMSFPHRLMVMLDNPQLNDITRWLPHGKGFQILDKKRFELEVMPLYFGKKSKYTSFTRKMNRWNFTRVTRGPETGAYYHPMFQRGQLELCLMMTCHDARSVSSSSDGVHGETMNPVALGIATPGMINHGFVDKGGSNSGTDSTTSQQNGPFPVAQTSQTPSLQALMMQQAAQRQQLNEGRLSNTEQQQQFKRGGSQPVLDPSFAPRTVQNATSAHTNTSSSTYSSQNFMDFGVLSPPTLNVSGGIAYPPGANISDIASAEQCLRETERLLNAMQDQQQQPPHRRQRQKQQQQQQDEGGIRDQKE